MKEFLVEVKTDKIMQNVIVVASNSAEAIVKAKKLYPNVKVFGAKEKR